MNESIYDKYGGYTVLHSVVSLFYKKIMNSENLIHYFENVDLSRLIDHQTKFLTTVLGGPIMYDSKLLKKAHAALKIPIKDFTEVAGLLQETLVESKLEKPDIDKIMEVVASFKNDIITT
ncbi:group I truncated hemoglobin [Fluviispira multicolorata]|uniref:Group 1 truncated hemoglobin n=1 Tax=Fluviispira multicolorata TaxID=2654512 RepID=A0A833N4L2_9BACT|nr:group 1 truncated hemoglobin [Fluviispira multicolorata]KAB8030921.1 group 1 truncated hemoglobin [Fluviispira multicolorata]